MEAAMFGVYLQAGLFADDDAKKRHIFFIFCSKKLEVYTHL
jgi:hypothetical protein